MIFPKRSIVATNIFDKQSFSKSPSTLNDHINQQSTNISYDYIKDQYIYVLQKNYKEQKFSC